MSAHSRIITHSATHAQPRNHTRTAGSVPTTPCIRFYKQHCIWFHSALFLLHCSFVQTARGRIALNYIPSTAFLLQHPRPAFESQALLSSLQSKTLLSSYNTAPLRYTHKSFTAVPKIQSIWTTLVNSCAPNPKLQTPCSFRP